MIKTAGVIAEYNPFHRGHQYHLEETRKKTGADFIVIVMSGNFVQRGEPAIFEKSRRTLMALLCGADLVLELPVAYATGSAEDFACGAVSLLHRLNCIDYLSFGSEEGELSLLQEAAAMLSAESPRFSALLREQLRCGHSFPRARSIALEGCGLNLQALSAASSSNNLLGIEYLKALIRFSSPIEPVTIRREGCGYRDSAIPENQSVFASASAIRTALAAQEKCRTDSDGTFLPDTCFSQIPEALQELYGGGSLFPLYPDDFSSLLHYQLLSCLAKDIPLSSFSDFSPELAQRLKENAADSYTFSQRISRLKTRQYTYTRISRCLIHLLLNIPAEEMQSLRSRSYPSYARILGFRRSAAPLLRQIQENSSIPLISKTAQGPRILSESPLTLWNQEIYASHIYHAVLHQKYGLSPQNEYSRPIVIL